MAKLQEQMLHMTGFFLTMQDTVTQQLRLLHEASTSTIGSNLVIRIEELDAEIDIAEQHLEKEALRLLALHAPIAHNLRQVLLMIQSTPDLERAGDYAKHMARLMNKCCCTHLDRQLLSSVLKTLEQMSDKLRSASFPLEAELAYQVIQLDDRVDEIYEQIQRQHLTQKDCELVQIIHEGQLWRAAERLGDHLKNVARRVTHFAESQSRQSALTHVKTFQESRF